MKEPVTWIDDRGITWGDCCICGRPVHTGDVPDEYALELCGDCGKPTCGDHRAEGSAARCDDCQREYSLYLKSFLQP